MGRIRGIGVRNGTTWAFVASLLFLSAAVGNAAVVHGVPSFHTEKPVEPGALRRWAAIADDGLRDPLSPAVGALQEPREALANLPPYPAGNLVDWAKALREGYINPRANILPDTSVVIRDDDIIMGNTAEMPMVRFPHRTHTEWLDCNNCHPKLFKEKFGATKISMYAILNGEQCGRCHGAVAFPLTECYRCHSVRREEFTGRLGTQPPGEGRW